MNVQLKTSKVYLEQTALLEVRSDCVGELHDHRNVKTRDGTSCNALLPHRL